MRASPETITSAMQLHFTGLSLRDIREFSYICGGRSSATSP